MSWFADLAGKAESLLNNIDEQTGVVLRNHANSTKDRNYEFKDKSSQMEATRTPRKKSPNVNQKKIEPKSAGGINTKSVPSRNNQVRIQFLEGQINANALLKTSSIKRNTQNITNNQLKSVEKLKCSDNRDQNGLRKRRNSLPDNLEMVNEEEMLYTMQNLEVENAMLKNEINVLNREVAELLERLRKTEDELAVTESKLSNSENLNNLIKIAKESMNTQLEELKAQLMQKSNGEITKYKEHNQELESELCLLKNKNKLLKERISLLDEEIKNRDLKANKMEKDLRQAQTRNEELQTSLDKINLEKQHLERDWEGYKVRVKNMLFSKDNEIKLLRDGSDLNEDTKLLMEQNEKLKEEKDEVCASLQRTKEEISETHMLVVQLEEKRGAAERLTAALRDALKEERMARNGAEAQCVRLSQDLQSLKMTTAQTVANLRVALNDKQEELELLRESTLTVATANTSSLNVADYDMAQNNDKVRCLTQTLIQKQGKIDSLLADNNILRIQLGKLESKYKAQLNSSRGKHSVVNFQDGESRARTRINTSPLSSLSLKVGVMIKRYPVFRTFFMVYLIVLHLWVLTVLFTSTPADFVPKPTKL